MSEAPADRPERPRTPSQARAEAIFKEAMEADTIEERMRLLDLVRLTTVIIDGIHFDFPDVNKLTIGEGRMCHRLTGLDPVTAMAVLDNQDPNLLAFMIWLAMNRKKPTSIEDVEAIGYVQLDLVMDMKEGAEDGPPVEGAGVGGEDEPGAGGSEMIPETSGSPTSSGSTESDLGT